MKIAVSGKGGVGKTTVSALLARSASDSGQAVLAVDADPDANLGSALGFSAEELANLSPIVQLKDLIAERTGSTPGQSGGWFVLNPRVDDVPDRFIVQRDGVKLLVMGGIRGGGSGCACPENAFLMHLLRHVVVERGDTVIVDMEAGLEHLGRGTARGVEIMLVVIEPGRRSIETARQIKSLAAELGLNRLAVVANKVREQDQEVVRRLVTDDLGLPLLAIIPYDARVAAADLAGRPAWEAVPQLLAVARDIRAQAATLLDGKPVR